MVSPNLVKYIVGPLRSQTDIDVALGKWISEKMKTPDCDIAAARLNADGSIEYIPMKDFYK